MTWEVEPREMMRCLHTDNITINIMNSHNTAMFIVDQGTFAKRKPKTGKGTNPYKHEVRLLATRRQRQLSILWLVLWKHP